MIEDKILGGGKHEIILVKMSSRGEMLKENSRFDKCFPYFKYLLTQLLCEITLSVCKTIAWS